MRTALLLGLAVLPAMAGDWSPRLAADYLDARQKEWFAWPRANGGAKPCISCHTGLPYLMARPALRKALGEKEPTQYETGLLESLRSRLDKTAPNSQALGTESVMAGLFLRTPAALDRMLALQLRDGKAPGAWNWYITDLDPWEEPESNLFGASLAAMAVNAAPAEYRQQPEVQARVAALMAFLTAPHEGEPLQNRLVAAWASQDEKLRAKITAEVLERQLPDGGWTLQSLGPFKTHANAPAPVEGSDAYATAFTTFALMKISARADDPKIARALGWLRAHQDREHGYWSSYSLNHQYKPDSMEIQFMRDAATGWASLALLEGGSVRTSLVQ